MNSQIQSPLETRIYAIPDVQPPEMAALERIEDLRRQLRYRVAEPRRWVGSVRRVLSARAIQGSNSIEGYDVSLEDALAAVEGSEPAEADERDWLAVLGYRRAMTYVLQLADDPHFEYSSALIRSLHFMVTEYSLEASPGLWRPGPIWVQNSATGEIVYEAPESDAVPELIEALISQLRSDDDVPAMVRAAMAHLNLVMIHPFRDGNGRMARCLQTLALARDRILSPEWMSIEEYLGAHTQAYYDILAEVGRGAWNPQLDARPWVQFCLKAHYIQAANVLRRIRESERLWIAIDELREKHELPERVVGSLFDAATGLRIRNSSHRKSVESAERVEISKQVATNDLGAMVRAGLIEQRGQKRGAYYEATDVLRAVRARVREEGPAIDVDSLFAV
ncbi:MAG TPA: Fic family protein [Solirubrobacterales bacterium]|nr:Fic family protein [Solirubrobacterales bacterium]